MAADCCGDGGVGGSGAGENNRCMAKWVDNGSVESNRLYLSRKTVMEMLRDRGYDVPVSELDGSLSEFRSLFGENPNLDRIRLCVPLRSNPHRKILVVFMGTEPITVKSIRHLHGQITSTAGLHGLMLILQSKMSHFARKELETFSLRVETFQITDLLVNITKHRLQPKHEILSNEDKERLLNKYGLENKQLPYLSEKDRLVRYHGVEKGQVVKFTYSEEPVGPLVTYRCIV